MSAGPHPQGRPSQGRPRRRRRLGGWVLFVAFVVVPLVEIYVLIQVGQVIGPWWTIALLIADSILGSWLIRREGRRAWQASRPRWSPDGCRLVSWPMPPSSWSAAP